MERETVRIVEEVDLWEGEDIKPLLPELLEKDENIGLFVSDNFDEGYSTQPVPDYRQGRTAVYVDNKRLMFYSDQDISDYECLNKMSGWAYLGNNTWSADMKPINCFILRHTGKSFKAYFVDKSDAPILGEMADKVPLPKATLSSDKTFVKVVTPKAWVYNDIMRKTKAFPKADGSYSLNFNRLIDFQILADSMEPMMPPFEIDDDVSRMMYEPIEGFDGTIESLKHIDIETLNIIRADKQSQKDRKAGKGKTIAEKMRESGYSTLYDLLMSIPKRYIDKNETEDLRSLEENETAVMLGTIDSSGEFGRDRARGSYFIVKTHDQKSMRVSFFNQVYLLSKFSVGDEVIVSGKIKFFQNNRQINGDSIDHADDAAIIPVVPVYRQQPSKGIRTKLIMSSMREMLSRIGNQIEMPGYFSEDNKMPTGKAFENIHFPPNLKEYKEALDTLAFYEMTYMQMIMQEMKSETESHGSIPMTPQESGLQEKAKGALPFNLTNAQSNALERINNSLSDKKSSSILINADVGSGKSVLAFLSCIRAAENGLQSVILAPTDVLARQLFSGLEKAVSPLADDVNIQLAPGNMKVREKKDIMKRLESGEIDICVGTHALTKDTVKYHNLGLVVIDEQQKFGAEDRSRLLDSRDDGLMPDIIMQTATPIPRSTAQAFYGDVEMIILDEKPPGRIPIETVWIRESPQDVMDQVANDMWTDIIEETKRGNQTFIITPLVQESDKIDAASVEATYENLRKGALSNLRIGYVHGKMKPDAQREAMEKFRAKEFDVLVASTIVEVGVDIPDATRIVVMSADRMGSSSIHQIRGRVGRNEKKSRCYLVSLGATKNSEKRLESIVKYTDGFDVAQADMEIRGTGMIFGTEQSGNSEMLFANIFKHRDLIEETVASAKRILNSSEREHALNDASNMFKSEGRVL